MHRSKCCMWNRQGLLAALLLLGAGTVAAQGDFQWHGFASQAAAHTDVNDYGGNSADGVALDLRELGLNASYRPNADWLISGQALARWAGAADEGDLRVDYAFVDHTLASGESHRVNMQVGKVKNPLGLFNTTRDVAHTRPGIQMPQSVYMERARNFFLAAPGLSLAGNHALEHGEHGWRLNLMRPEAGGEDLEYLFIFRPAPGAFQGRASWLGQWTLDLEGGKYRLGLSLGELRTRYKPAAVDFFTAGESTYKPRVLSLELNQEDWSLTGEYMLLDSRGKNYGPFGGGVQDPNTVAAWYLQATFRPLPRTSVYARRDVFYLDDSDKSSARFAQATGLPGHLLYGKDWTLGVRRDWKDWAFSGEMHVTDGTVWLSPLDTPFLGQRRKWRMFLLQAAYRF